MSAAVLRPHLRLVNPVSSDTVSCLRELLAQAERGEVVGIAYAALQRGRRYTVDACGETDRNPTFARGMVDALSDELKSRVWGE
jgi:hypothetical protein